MEKVTKLNIRITFETILWCFLIFFGINLMIHGKSDIVQGFGIMTSSLSLFNLIQVILKVFRNY